MKGRQFAWIWSIAILTAVGALVSLAALHQLKSTSYNELCETVGLVETAFVGSSLTRAAVPVGGEITPPVLPGAGRHVRFYRAGVTQDGLLDLVEGAEICGASVLFVEVNPLISRIIHRHASSTNNLLARIFTLSKNARKEFNILIRRQARNEFGYLQLSTYLEGIFDGLASPIDPDYGIAVIPFGFQDRWRKLLGQAQKAGTRIVLVEYPRSASASQMLGLEQQENLQTAARLLAEKEELLLFQTERGSWPDTYFADRAHMNANGRARFLQELNQWWALVK